MSRFEVLRELPWRWCANQRRFFYVLFPTSSIIVVPSNLPTQEQFILREKSN